MNDQSSDSDTDYLDAWKQLADRIRRGQSFSGRERNCCFLNTRSDRWADVSAAFGLDLLDDSRAIASVDWDHDGDLDLWLTNRTAPRVRYLRNDLPRDATSSSIGIALRGNPSRHCPADAIGARVEITCQTTGGQTVRRSQTLTAGDGFLSQSSKVMHFGFSRDERLEQVTVRWPGSKEAETWKGLEAGGRYLLQQGQAASGPVAVTARSGVRALPPDTDSRAAASSDNNMSRVWLSTPLPVSTNVRFTSFDRQSAQALPLASGRPILLTFWASWCQPCLQELSAWKEYQEALADARVDVMALSVEALDPNAPEGSSAADELASQLDLPFLTGLASHELVQEFDGLKKQALYRDDPLPLPVSFLIDGRGRLRTIYAGPASCEQILDDVAHLHLDANANRDRAVPFAGRWAGSLFVTHPIAIATIFREERQFDEARNYLLDYLDKHPAPPANLLSREATDARRRLADVHHLLGRLALDEQQLDAAQQALRRSLELFPKHWSALMDLGEVYQKQGERSSAQRLWLRALELQPRHPRTLNQLGLLSLEQGKAAEAEQRFQQAIDAQSDYFPAANNLAWMWATHPESAVRRGKEAVFLAQRLLERIGPRTELLDTLAAAYAETGDFERAVSTATQAIEQAQKSRQTVLAQEITTRLEAYRQRQPYRSPTP